MKPSIVCASAACLAAAFLGCNLKPSGPATVPVSGTVTVSGQPLADAEVEFIHTEFASYGKTDSAGQFRLIQGAVPGENRVVIRKTPPGFANNPEEGMDFGQLEAASLTADSASPVVALQGSEVPLEYSDVNNTPLKYVIPEGGTDSANFNL